MLIYGLDMFTWMKFISNRVWYSLTSFFSSWKNKKSDALKQNWEKVIILKRISDIDKKYDKTALYNLANQKAVYSNIVPVTDVVEQEQRKYYKRQVVKNRPSMSDAACILKKNEWSVILWRRGILTDEQVWIIARSNEKVLDLSLFDLTDHQLEILSQYRWEEIVFWLKKITDKQSEIFSKYNANTLNLSNLLRITDYQLFNLTLLKWKKLNLRDLVLSRVQKTMLYKYQWKVINRAYAQWNEMNQKIIEQQKELKRQRENARQYKSIAYTSFQYA